MITLLVLTFVVTVATGPAGQDVRARRRALLDSPRARVTYLPSGCCKGSKSLA